MTEKPPQAVEHHFSADEFKQEEEPYVTSLYGLPPTRGMKLTQEIVLKFGSQIRKALAPAIQQTMEQVREFSRQTDVIQMSLIPRDQDAKHDRRYATGRPARRKWKRKK